MSENEIQGGEFTGGIGQLRSHRRQAEERNWQARKHGKCWVEWTKFVNCKIAVSSFSRLLLPSTSSQVSKLRSDCGDSVNKMEGMEYELARRQRKIDECETEIDRLVKKGDWHEAERRRLHNTIQV